MKEKIPNEISKKLVLSFPSGKLSTSGKKRVSTDAAAAISEALRLFLLDAHRRSVIEAECDEEVQIKHLEREDEPSRTTKTPIGANHVTRVAGDLLMDYS